MASSKEIQRILTCLQTSILDKPETLPSSAVDDIIAGIRHHALLSSTASANQSSFQEYLKTINGFLRSSSERPLGLRLLRETLRQCGTDVFKANYASWYRQLHSIALVEISPSREVRAAALDCLVDVIAAAASLPECARELTGRDYVPQSVVSLLSSEKESSLEAELSCLIECARSFPGATGSIGKGKLEKKSMEFLQDPRLNGDEALTHQAALFFALLPKLGGAGVGGARYREAWESQFALLLETINDVVDELFQGVGHYITNNPQNNNNSSGGKSSRLPLQLIRVEDDMRSFRLLHRFRTLTECLSAMLSTDVGVSVRITFTRILSFVFRVCNVTPSSLTFKPTNESLMLAAILPELYSASFGVLKIALKTAGNRLFNHGLSVNRLLLQMLNATTLKDVQQGQQQRFYGADSCFQKCRGFIYDFLTSWLYVYPSVKTGTKGESALKWVTHMLNDARPAEAEKATLKANESSVDGKRGVAGSGGGGGKARKKMKGSLFESASVTSDRKTNPLADADVCAASLKAAAAMIMTQGRALPPEIHKTFVEFCVPLLQSICLRGRTNLPSPIPYSSAECRLALYQLLKSLTMNPTPKWPPPLAAASAIFRQGVVDADEAVRRFCVEANVIVANLVHPRVHPIQMPIVVPKELEESVSRKKRKREAEEEEGEAMEDEVAEKEKRRESLKVPDFVNDVEEKSGRSGGITSMETEEVDDGNADAEDEEIEANIEDEAKEDSVNDNFELYEADKRKETDVEEPNDIVSDLHVATAPGHDEPLGSSRLDSASALPSRNECDPLKVPLVATTSVVTAQESQHRIEDPKKTCGTVENDEDPELAAMLRDFNPDADPDPI